MSSKKKDVFKKHHFWILLGVVPLLVLIAVTTVWSSVGDAVEDKLKAYKASESSMNGKTNPKQEELIKKIEVQSSKVQIKKDELHKLNWERQKDMYTWPKDALGHLKKIERANLKFGDTIPYAESQYDEFKKDEVYLAEFSTVYPKKKDSRPTTGMADQIAPTQFKDGWQSVLRHVNSFDDRALTSEQIWLMMEDIWIQRSLLEAVRSVNAQMAEFQRVKFEKNGVVVDDPKIRKFRSRIWELELEVTNKNNKLVLGGKLINHTDRLQLMGLNNTMIVKVWLDKGVGVTPFEFKIGGEFVPGNRALKPDGKTPANVLDIVPTDDHIIPQSVTVSEIVKVEQVFDTRTVPVRRIDAMGLGFRDARSAEKQLFAPTFPAFAPKPDAVAVGPGGPGGLGGPGGDFGRPPIGVGPFGQPGVGTGTVGAAGGTVETVVNANKKRYLQVTPEVRRMPVGIALVVDQAYMQDVLLAFANSQLKLQITQVDWARFRDKLSGTGSASDPSSPNQLGGDIERVGSGGGISKDFGTPMFPVRPPVGIGPGSGPGPGPGTMGPGGYPPYPGSGAATVSESQLTSGLIQLQVYGVVSLYEKYVPPDAKETPKDTPKETVEPKPEPKPKTDPKTPEVKAKEPATDPKEPKEPAKEPKEPAMPDPKTSKMRRRIR